jgi:hypothetical protein
MSEDEQNNSKGEQYNKRIEKYYESLINQYYDAHKSFDKMVLTFSGGALSISLVLYKEKIGLTTFPILSWICWGFSLLFLLLSWYFCTLAYRRALKKFDEEENTNFAGGIWDKMNLYVLPPLGLVSFFVGLIFFFLKYI